MAREGPRYYFVQGGFDPEFARFSPMRLLLTETMRRAFDDLGCTIYDLGPGYESYKFDWKPVVGTKLLRLPRWAGPVRAPCGRRLRWTFPLPTAPGDGGQGMSRRHPRAARSRGRDDEQGRDRILGDGGGGREVHRHAELLLGEELALSGCFADGWRGRPVLDLGCGGGRTTYFLERRGADVVGVDISRPLIAAARERCPAASFCVGDAKALNFRNESFDAVLFSFNSLDCLQPKSDREASIAEIRRVLRPGGRFILSHHNLAGLFFSWYRNLCPRKLWFRARHILNGDVLQAECYLPDRGSGGLDLYYAWPSKFISDLEAAGFRLLNIYPNSRLLWSVQRTLKTTAATKLADPWPYYVFARPSNCQGRDDPPHRGA